MEINRFGSFIHIFLVNAGQMAYIEEAGKTHAMLRQFSELFRYMIKNEATVLLGEEIKALEVYINIQSTRYEGRFDVNLEGIRDYGDILIGHLCLIDFTDSVLDTALVEYEDHFSFSLRYIFREDPCIAGCLECGPVKKYVEMQLPR